MMARCTVLLVLVALGAVACGRGKANLAARSGSSTGSARGPSSSPARPEAGELHVVVVDRAGVPLSGVSAH